MSDSGLGFSPSRFVLLIVVIAISILVFELVSDFGGGLIKGQVKRTTSKFNQQDNTVPVFVLTQKEEQPVNITIQESTPPTVIAALSGEEVYNSACIACHMTGAGGAPQSSTRVLNRSNRHFSNGRPIHAKRACTAKSPTQGLA